MINPLPSAPAATDAVDVFDVKAFAFCAAMQGFVTEANATATEMQANADITAALALGMALPNYAGTSTTSLTIGTGAKSMTTQTGKSWVVGQTVVVGNGAGAYMKGAITAYSGSTLDVNVTSVVGSGTFTSWSIGLSYAGLALAAAGANADIFSLNALASVNGGPIAGLRNRIINGNFGINQRAVSGTVTLAAGAYGHDRWKAGAGGCTYTFATALNVTTLTISAGTLMQVIEGANLESGAFKLSWSGTATGRVDSGSYGASGVAGTAVGGTNQTVEFGTGTLSKVQYEFGSVATTFEPRPMALEDLLCKRYYEKVGGSVAGDIYGVAGCFASGYYVSCLVHYATKRALPTATVVGTWTVNQVAQPSLSGSAGLSCLSLSASSSAGGGQNYFASTTSAYLTVSAEL